MNIILSCYYGFTGNIKYNQLHPDYIAMLEPQRRIFEVELKASLLEAGLMITHSDQESIEFILGSKLKEELLEDKGITSLNVSDYLFLLNQSKYKAETDAIFKSVNEALCKKGCYYFNPQKYGYLTYSLIK